MTEKTRSDFLRGRWWWTCPIPPGPVLHSFLLVFVQHLTGAEEFWCGALCNHNVLIFHFEFRINFFILATQNVIIEKHWSCAPLEFLSSLPYCKIWSTNNISFRCRWQHFLRISVFCKHLRYFENKNYKVSIILTFEISRKILEARNCKVTDNGIGGLCSKIDSV